MANLGYSATPEKQVRYWYEIWSASSFYLPNPSPVAPQSQAVAGLSKSSKTQSFSIVKEIEHNSPGLVMVGLWYTPITLVVGYHWNIHVLSLSMIFSRIPAQETVPNPILHPHFHTRPHFSIVTWPIHGSNRGSWRPWLRSGSGPCLGHVLQSFLQSSSRLSLIRARCSDAKVG